MYLPFWISDLWLNLFPVAYNNLLSNVASGRNRDQILLSLNRFFEVYHLMIIYFVSLSPITSQNGQAARREAIRSRAREIQDDINILWHSVQDNEGILNRRKFNTPAILNRFQTVFNGIEWFDNAFYPTVWPIPVRCSHAPFICPPHRSLNMFNIGKCW